MIHYHGFGINPYDALIETVICGHALFTWKNVIQSQIDDALMCCQSFMVDNGAFIAWKNGTPITDWMGYYEWVYSMSRKPSFDFAIVPDLIGGSEEDNDALLNEWPHSEWIGAPVWHLHESLDRLDRLANEWPRICIGSSGQWSIPGTSEWWIRIYQALDVVCDKEGIPVCKIHGLRMLNPEVFTKIPLSSADSSSVARNLGDKMKWKGTYIPPDRASKAYVLRKRIENFNSPLIWERKCIQENFSLL